MAVTVREYRETDLPAMVSIWNEVVSAGDAFPQEQPLDEAAGREFFSAQTRSAVVVDDEGSVLGLYILHPNNVGRCSHIANASYAVASTARGRHVGRALVEECLDVAPTFGFRILQFNAVVATNLPARALYESLGFESLGTIPSGFRLPDGSFEDICLYFYRLVG